jgi:3-phosphoshikimate 1-carboxyvinyltransferase
VHRALFLALLASGRSEVKPVVWSGDLKATRGVVEALGAQLEDRGSSVHVKGGELLWTPSLYCMESGTTIRIASAVAALLDKPVVLYGSGRISERPVRGLAESLRELGAEVILSRGCCPPVAVRGPLRSGTVQLDAGESSQYLTALMVAGSALEGGLEIKVKRLSSRGYIDITVEVLESFGVNVLREGYSLFRVEGPPRPSRYRVPGDWSSASVLAALAAALGRVEFAGLDPGSQHPDRAIVDVLVDAGAGVSTAKGRLVVSGRGTIQGFTDCVDDHPDLAPALMVLAAAACGTSRICCVRRLRLKESDRLSALLDLARQSGVDASYDGECIEVRGTCGQRRPVSALSPPPDHRMVMAAAGLGLVTSSTPFTVDNAEAVSKSYPGFWSDLQRLGVHVEPL